MPGIVLLIVSLIGALSSNVWSGSLPLSARLGQDEVMEGQRGIGNIGCSFSKAVCDPDVEFCFNDNAFGRCLPLYGTADESRLYRYSMSKSDSHILEKEMERLFAQGYRWGHAYTQCVLQSYLDAIRHGWEEDGLGLGSKCVESEDQDLKGALRAFSDDVEPWDLAFIKFAPTPVEGSPDGDLVQDSNYEPSQPDFAREIYVPAQALQHHQPSKQSIPVIHAPVLDDNFLEEILEDYLLEQEPREGPAKKSIDPATTEMEKEVMMGWNEVPLGLGGRVNENIIQPKIFTSAYNTPDSFRHGLETRDDLEFLSDDPNLLPPEPVSLDLDEKELTRLLRQEAIQHQIREEVAAEEVEAALGNPPAATLIIENEDDGDGDADANSVGLNPRLYTEGGLVFLDNYPNKRFLYAENSEEPEFQSAFNGVGAPDLTGSGFERRERLDVKKPGPWYRTVNNFAFENAEEKEKEQGTIKHRVNSKVEARQASSQGTVSEDGPEGAGDGDKTKGESPTSKQAEELLNLIKKASSAAAGAEKTEEAIPAFGQLDVIDTSYVNVHVKGKIGVWNGARELVNLLADFLDLKHSTFQEVRLQENVVTFKVEPNERGFNATDVARRIDALIPDVRRESGVTIESAEVGFRTNGRKFTRDYAKDPGYGAALTLYPNSSLIALTNLPQSHPLIAEDGIRNKNLYIATFAICGVVAAAIVAAFFIFLIRNSSKKREKFARLAQDDPATETSKDYQELCRARMASKNNEKPESIRAVQRVQTNVSKDSDGGGTSSSRSSTSSWTEEPALTNMDISTGHMVLSYMEDHLKKKDRLDQEWAALCTYEADPGLTTIAEKADNSKKNRYSNSLPYDHSRVILNDLANVGGTDYINASTITDHDPRNPAYIATQGPLPATAADFWQMVWEQGSVVIVTLTRLTENGTALCHRYWPEEGSELHHIYEVHLVSEHIWCDEYLVRSFYLKNLKTGETRTVTQFHFLAWPENGVPGSTKSILEFRRKVNKSYRGRSCPIIVHCSDGAGRTGTYCLIDMVLNRMAKGAKEIDIAASLEHIRDQRPGMVRTKQQFEFVLMAVAEEVHAILKALPQ